MSQGCPEERAQPLLRCSLQAASLRLGLLSCSQRRGRRDWPAASGLQGWTWVLSSTVLLCDLGRRERGGPFPSLLLSQSGGPQRAVSGV